MKPQFDNLVMSSFLLWFDHTLLKKGEGFFNKTTQFYNNPDKWNFGGQYTVYNAPFKQFVYDTSITGATVMTGVSVTDSVGGTNVYNLSSDALLAINYDEGQVTIKTDEFAGSVSSVQGTYSVKEFAVKLSSETEEKLLFETKYYNIPEYTQVISTGLYENEQPFPVIFLKHNGSINNPGAIGGQEMTEIDIRALVIADSQFNLDAVCSIFRDSSDENFYLLSESELPINSLGSFKNDVVFSYEGLISGKSVGGSNGLYIEDSIVSKFGRMADNEVLDANTNIFGGVIDFKIKQFRRPSTC